MAVDIVARALALKAQGQSAADYNNLQNTPIVNVDLTRDNFVPMSGAYYRHIGDDGIISVESDGQTLDISVTKNTIYRYIDGIYIEIGSKTPAPVYVQGYYNGDIIDSDWVLKSDGFYYYTVTHSTHNLNNPYVDTVMLPTDDGYINATYTYTRLLNNDIKFKSDKPTVCKYTIVGNK